MLERRVHLMMDEERYQLLEQMASDQGSSVAALIREAVSIAYGQASRAQERAAAYQVLTALDPIAVPADPAALDAEAASLWTAS